MQTLRARAATETNSLVWLLWHMARSEDVHINVLLMKHPQVLDRAEWTRRLRVERRDTGSCFSLTAAIAQSAGGS